MQQITAASISRNNIFSFILFSLGFGQADFSTLFPAVLLLIVISIFDMERKIKSFLDANCIGLSTSRGRSEGYLLN